MGPASFHLSTKALMIGWLLFVLGIGAMTGGAVSRKTGQMYVLEALYILIGTLAYRSIKRRKIGLRESSGLRRSAEAFAVSFVVFHSQAFSSYAEKSEQLILYIAIPLWVLAACCYAWLQAGKEPEAALERR